MSLRLLYMKDLSYGRRTQLAQHDGIGKGTFASVFARSSDSASVPKVTTDAYGYYLRADGMWLQMRERGRRVFSAPD